MRRPEIFTMNDDGEPMAVDDYPLRKRREINRCLSLLIAPSERYPARIYEAMRYSVDAGGKRLRPILCLATIDALHGEEGEGAYHVACALELIHTYSLMHDDLPCMDNDDIRRGKPTSHKVFGEAVALLAGSALLTRAFEVVARAPGLSARQVQRLVCVLADAAGAGGLIGGQTVDCESEGVEVTQETLEYIHACKTAALMEASVVCGAIVADATDERTTRLSRYGRALGMAFQITDDILDASGDERKMGKRVRKDSRAKKATYPALFGLDASRKKADSFIREALEALDSFDRRADHLRAIARSVLGRDR
jgi:geranylgeranyl diphosphate synthase type II